MFDEARPQSVQPGPWEADRHPVERDLLSPAGKRTEPIVGVRVGWQGLGRQELAVGRLGLTQIGQRALKDGPLLRSAVFSAHENQNRKTRLPPAVKRTARFMAMSMRS